MHRRSFFKMIGLAPLALVRPPRPLLHADDIMSDGWDGSITWGQIVIGDITYTDSEGHTPTDLTTLHDSNRAGGGVVYHA